MKKQEHVIKAVAPGSIAEEMEIEAGDVIVTINGETIEDIFDYQFLVQEEYIEVLVRKRGGEEWLLEIDKEPDEDLGIEFENGLMDHYRSCSNKCIFCFIDQMPPGMRETLYFKDDDARLSFLQGNYITLTNLSDADADRIIKYHLSPINISFQTTNPELRCMMLHNRFAGEALLKVQRFYDANIVMNGQIVLCKGINDSGELERSIGDLYRYVPCLQSVSVVPVGLSKFRDGLYPLEPFEREDAENVIDLIEHWQEKAWREHHTHFVHASDEWYLLAERDLPEKERYDGYLQLENGVGMLRLLMEEFDDAMKGIRPSGTINRELSAATGKLAYPVICSMAERMMHAFPGLKIRVYEITNEFFGEMITVSGLITGQDLKRQLRGKKLGERLLLPQNMLRSGEDYFLDDITVKDLENALQVKIDIVKSSGYDFVESVLA